MINDVIIRNALKTKTREVVDDFIDNIMGSHQEISEERLINKVFDYWQELTQDQSWPDRVCES